MKGKVTGLQKALCLLLAALIAFSVYAYIGYDEARSDNAELTAQVSEVRAELNEVKAELAETERLLEVAKSEAADAESDAAYWQTRYEQKPTQTTSANNNGGTNTTQTTQTTVYVTNTGSKYHRWGCQYLWNSSIAVTLSYAKSVGYSPCSRCNPPR